MKCVYIALTLVYGLAWKCGMIVIAVALLAAMNPGGGDDGLTGPSRPDSIQYVMMTAADKATRVVMTAPAGGYSSKCTLVDEDGRQLLQATYSRHGCLNVEWGDTYPVRPRSTTSRDGKFDLRASDGGNSYELLLRPGGVSGVTAVDASKCDYRGFGYTKEGVPVVDPWEIGTAP